jgi:hypothetical protein
MSQYQRVIMLQTADDVRYAEMLAVGRTVNEAYALERGIQYHCYIGIKRGYHPWHACFNRIILLHEFMAAGFHGWIFYLDADAYVYDREFDLADYLEGYSDKALIASRGGAGQSWDINAGVLLINFGHEIGPRLIEEWHTDFMGTSDEQLRKATIWGLSVDDDQRRLHRILRKNPKYLEALHTAKQSFLNNHKASFVRHVLRVCDGRKLSMAERISIMKQDISEMRAPRSPPIKRI